MTYFAIAGIQMGISVKNNLEAMRFRLDTLMAIYPWVVPHEAQRQNLHDFPNLKRWFNAMQKRPAVIKAYEQGAPWSSRPAVTEEGKNCYLVRRPTHSQ